MGVRGSYLLEQGREHRQECVRADVVDALGAGDAFIAAFLAEYHAGGGDLADAAQKASVFAAQCCGHYGAFGHAMPHPDRCAGEQADLCCEYSCRMRNPERQGLKDLKRLEMA